MNYEFYICIIPIAIVCFVYILYRTLRRTDDTKKKKGLSRFFSFLSSDSALYRINSIFLNLYSAFLITFGSIYPLAKGWFLFFGIEAKGDKDFKIDQLALNHAQAIIATGVLILVIANLKFIVSGIDSAAKIIKAFLSKSDNLEKILNRVEQNYMKMLEIVKRK